MQGLVGSSPKSVQASLLHCKLLVNFYQKNYPTNNKLLHTNVFSYKEDGHCKGEPEYNLPAPTRLQWDIPEKVYFI